MGKVRVRVLGLEEVEKKQKEEQKKRREEKKKKKVEGVGLKGGERVVQVEVSEEDLKKQKKAGETVETKKKEESKRRFVKVRHPRGKKYKEAVSKIRNQTKNSPIDLDKAVRLLKEVSFVNFDEAVELHLNVKKTGLKGEVVLPFGTGKKRNIVIVDDKFVKDLEAGKADLGEIDVLISTPVYMRSLTKFAKVLGPKKLFPNPKQGTLVDNPEEAVRRFEGGSVQWKTEPKFPLVHQMIGRISFKTEDLVENARAFIRSVGKHNIKQIFIKTTMSPSIEISLDSV